MNPTQVLDLVTYVFDNLQAAETIADLDKIFNSPKAGKIKNNRIDEEIYPQLHFKITAEELQDAGFLTQEKTFLKDITKVELDPLTKLLYAICWKNGDLKKVKHIIQGITNQPGIDDKNDGLVFYQFGKYLTKKEGEPIIDQHVLRVYAVFEAVKSDNTTEQIRKKSAISKKDKPLINSYKKWLTRGLKEELRKNEEYGYYIDKVLFALGKTIKIK